MIEQVELREGWYWPKSDTNCWNYMNQYPDVPQKIANYIDPDQRRIIVQAGGNAGFYPKQYATLFDTVYTFEPDWLNFYCLNLNVIEPNVVKNQSCLGNTHQLVGLNIKEINRGKNFVNGNGIYPVYRIDDLALNECSAIQLDIEGYEYYALLGAQETITKFKPLIVVEVWEQLTNRFGKHLNRQTHDFLTSLGYEHIDTLYDSDYIYQHK